MGTLCQHTPTTVSSAPLHFQSRLGKQVIVSRSADTCCGRCLPQHNTGGAVMPATWDHYLSSSSQVLKHLRGNAKALGCAKIRRAKFHKRFPAFKKKMTEVGVKAR